MLYDTEVLNENDYKKECARLLIAFENSNYKQENTINIAKNVTIGYGLDLLKCYGQPKDFLLEYLPDDSKKLKIGNEELTFYGIIEKYRANKTGFTDPKIVKGYLQNKIFNFSLTQEQAQEVLENMIPKYEEKLSAITTNYLPYSKERASLLSMRYLGKGIENNGLIKAFKDNSRFLSWFIIRYKTNVNTYLGYIARSSDEADIYLSNPNTNQLNLIFDIFSYLNTRKEIINYRKYEYNESIDSYTSHNKRDILLKLALWYENDLDFIRFNSANKVNNISKSNITNIISQLTKKPINNITTTLHPYLTYINHTFAKGTISEYALSNIYVIQAIKDCENLNVALSNRNDTRDFTPLLIICLKPNMHQENIAEENIDTYSIRQPSNTFLSIVVFEGAKLDISKIDTKQSEIIYARLKDENNIEAMLLQGSQQSMILDSTANTLTIKGNSNETYIFDKAKNTTQDSQISPILKVYINKEANPNDYIEIHNFAKESINDRNTYILDNDCNQRYCGITLFLNQATTPHNTNCSNEGNFQVIVQNLDRYGLNNGDMLYLYSCENRKEISATIDDDYSATFNITLNLPKQAEVSQRCLSSHIILKTKPMESTETIQEQKICSNPNFQINKSAKLAKQYIITDAKLNTQKQPITTKVTTTQFRVKDMGYTEKYLHYSINSIVKLKAIYNLKNPSQDKTRQTKWAYIITDNKTAPIQKQLNEKQYKHFLQNNSNEACIGEKLEFQIKKEWLDINKPQYLYIYAYLNTPSTKVYLCIEIQYPLSLRFNGKELMILEWGEVKRDRLDSATLDKNKIFIARSGKPLISNQDSTTQHNRDSLILNPDNPKEYFDYSKQRQKDKDKGAIPEGIYYIDISQSTENKPSGIRTLNQGTISKILQGDRQNKWGKNNIPIYTDKDCTNTIESNTQRDKFYIHGGESYGDNGGIDLSKEDTRFFQVLESIKEEYKEVLESLKDNNGKIVVKLEVGYGTGEMVLEVVRRWEYKTRKSDGSYTYEINKPTISEFKLKKDGSNILQGYMLERTGPDTIESRKNRRIPIGEYNVMWYKSFNYDKDKDGWYGRTIYYENDKEFAEIAIKCEDSRCIVKAPHSHIVPLIYNKKVSKGRYILIHVGRKFDDSNGCLLVGSKLNNSINPTEFVPGDTRPATRELIKQMILHDKKAYQNFSFINENYKRVERDEISNFKLIIKEDYK